jgi:hypothetical protein
MPAIADAVEARHAFVVTRNNEAEVLTDGAEDDVGGVAGATA